MKNKPAFKIFIILCVLLALSAPALADLSMILDQIPIDIPAGININAFKGSFDTFGENEFSGENSSEDTDVINGFALTLELGRAVYESLGMGVGATYQFPRGLDISGGHDSKFNFIPLYGLIKLWTDAAIFFPYGILQLGYNFFLGNDSFKTFGGETEEMLELGGGLYWGLGGGIIFPNNFEIELLYTVNKGTMSGDGDSYNFDVNYSKLSVSAGITF